MSTICLEESHSDGDGGGKRSKEQWFLLMVMEKNKSSQIGLSREDLSPWKNRANVARL